MEGGAEGRRGRGRPLTSWMGNSKEWSRKSAVELTKMAETPVSFSFEVKTTAS